MAMTVITLEDTKKVDVLTADRRLYADASAMFLLEDGDPEAAVLVCGAGQRVSPKWVAKLGLSQTKKGVIVQGKQEHKEVEPKANKAAKVANTKQVFAPKDE